MTTMTTMTTQRQSSNTVVRCAFVGYAAALCLGLGLFVLGCAGGLRETRGETNPEPTGEVANLNEEPNANNGNNGNGGANNGQPSDGQPNAGPNADGNRGPEVNPPSEPPRANPGPGLAGCRAER